MADHDDIDAGADGGTIVLPDRVDLGSAGRLRETALAADGDMSIDASGVSVVTSPGFQVLMAARDRQRARGRSLRLLRPSAGFAACAATLGVTLDRLQTPGDER